eukprot:6212184-Pleurochrysis_carterae.AAC.2
MGYEGGEGDSGIGGAVLRVHALSGVMQARRECRANARKCVRMALRRGGRLAKKKESTPVPPSGSCPHCLSTTRTGRGQQTGRGRRKTTLRTSENDTIV